MFIKNKISVIVKLVMMLVLTMGICGVTPAQASGGTTVSISKENDTSAIIQDMANFPTVVTTSPKHGDVLLNNPSSLSIQFSVNMLADGTAFAVNKTTNYLLVEDGIDGKFQTVSCTTQLTGDDTLISISKVVYNATNSTSTLTVSNWPLLNQGSYQLLICASTRITDISGNRLNDGKDVVVRFVLIKDIDLYPYINPGGGSGEAVGIGDFNHDSLTDIVMSTSTQVLVYLRSSNGNLNAPITYQAGSRSEVLAVGDLNHDGWVDIATADFSSNTISVFLQQINGTLAPRITFPTLAGPDAIAIGDVTGDGLMDVVISHWNSPYIGVFTQNTNGNLNPIIRYNSPQAGSDDIAIGDVNNDGRNDVVKMNGQGLGPDLSVYLQNADGTLAGAVPYSHSCSSCLGGGVGIGDTTGDGLLDVVMSYGGNRPNSKLAVFAQGQDGLLQSPVVYDAYDIPQPVELADINLDGKQDVLTLHGGWLSLGVFAQKDGFLQTESLYTIPNINGFEPQALAVGDINQDGAVDIAISDDIYGLTVLYHHEKPVPQVIIGGNTSPIDGEELSVGTSQITVQFDRQMNATGSDSSVNNSSNYLLVNSGLDSTFQTVSCADGPTGDDSIITIDNVTYDDARYFSTLSINSGVPVGPGNYRLFVCGTTSIEDTNGVKLNGGLSDGIITFTIWLTPHKISGNAGIGGVTLSYTDNGSRLAIADGTGDYSFKVSGQWSGIVTPSKANYEFTPPSKNYAEVSSDISDENYSAVPIVLKISGNTGVGKAFLNYFDGGSKYVESDVNGDYSLTVPIGWYGSVTPSKFGYKFTPTNRIYNYIQSNQLNQDFSAEGLLIISGNVGIESAVLYYEENGMFKTTTATTNGSYSIAVPTGWSGSVTPNKSGYRFTPINRIYNNLQDNQQNQDFSAIRLYIISGNAGIDGAMLNYEDDGVLKTAIASGNGNYSFPVPENWSGTVTPSRTDYVFVPSSKTYHNVQENQLLQNYTAIQTVMTISGNVRYEGVEIRYTEDGNLKTILSESNGNYAFKINAGWSGIVTPSKAGVIFEPANKSYVSIQSNQINQNFKASILVTTIADSGPGSLRQAILDTAYGDMITFHPNLAGQTITLASTLSIGRGLTVNGSGLNPRVEISGNGNVQIFSVDPGYDAGGLPPNVKFQSLILKNGKRAMGMSGGNIFIEDVAFWGNAAYDGGAIYSSLYNTTITITRSDFKSNTAQHFGGAIFIQFGSLDLQSSTFLDNTAGSVGGAIAIERQGPYKFENNTFSNNRALSGGAIRFESVEDSVILQGNLFSDNHATLHGGAIFEMLAYSSASFTLYNNTFYANQADDSAGAISIDDFATLTNNTFSHNKALRQGASLYTGYTADVVLNNNIFANGMGTEECYLYNSGLNSLSGSHNLAEDSSSACLSTLTGASLLGPLTDNGGSILTMALLPGSAAINTGDDSNCPSTDQRGITRPQGSHCDIGAYEYEEIVSNHPILKSRALTPSSLTTQFGTTVGSLSSLGLLEQSNADDDPAAYVSFQTPNGAYLGYQSFFLPEDAQTKLVSTMLLQVNFKGPETSTQVWTWSIYDPTSNLWIDIGSSIGTEANLWQTLTFRIRQPWRYVSPGREIRIQLRSNNTNGDALIDYEALHVTYLTIPATPVAPPVSPHRPGVF